MKTQVFLSMYDNKSLTLSSANHHIYSTAIGRVAPQELGPCPGVLDVGLTIFLAVIHETETAAQMLKVNGDKMRNNNLVSKVTIYDNGDQRATDIETSSWKDWHY